MFGLVKKLRGTVTDPMGPNSYRILGQGKQQYCPFAYITALVFHTTIGLAPPYTETNLFSK
jgi:hypothetical protein